MSDILRVRAHRQVYVCEVGQERDGDEILGWVLDSEDPCQCTGVTYGGLNMERPWRQIEPVYFENPWFGDEIAELRRHYRLHCDGKKL